MLVGDAVCRSPECPQQYGDRSFLLGEGTHDERRGFERGAIVRSDLIDCDTAFGPPEFQRPGARLEADRRLLDFRLEQYLKYLRAVRAAGLEPNGLLCGLGEKQVFLTQDCVHLLTHEQQRWPRADPTRPLKTSGA